MCKRRPPESSTRRTSGEVKELIEDAVEEMESRLSLFLSKELHDFKTTLQSQFEVISGRIRDLEEHVNEKDIELEKMATELKETREEVKRLNERTESAEMNSRIPCLVLSGRALAPQRGSRLAAPLPSAGGSAPQGTDTAGPAGPDERAGASSARGGAKSGRPGGVWRAGEAEDINKLVIGVVRARLPGLVITDDDIDRAHRLPGPNHRVIVRFVRSGAGSVRGQLMTRRLELTGRDELFINESLTAHKSQIFRSLLEAKKQKKIYTVYTRWGHVHFKAEKFGTSSRIDSVDKLRELGLPVKQ